MTEPPPPETTADGSGPVDERLFRWERLARLFEKTGRPEKAAEVWAGAGGPAR